MSFTLVWPGYVVEEACFFSPMCILEEASFSPMCILEEAGVPYNCKAPDDNPPHTLTSPMIITNGQQKAHPMIITPGGVQVSQVGVIAMALGKELNMWPTELAMDMKAMQLCCDADDFWTFIRVGAGGDSTAYLDHIGKWVDYFKGQFDSTDGDFMLGPTLTAADYVIFHVLLTAFESSIADRGTLSSSTGLGRYMENMKLQKGFLAVDRRRRCERTLRVMLHAVLSR